MKKEKKTRRDQQKYPAIDPRFNLKSRRDYAEIDYFDKLNSKEKAFLNKFTEEYVNGGVKKGDKKALHKTDTLRKDCYQRNNLRNRDVYNRSKTGDTLAYIDDLRPTTTDEKPPSVTMADIDNVENAILESITQRRYDSSEDLATTSDSTTVLP